MNELCGMFLIMSPLFGRILKPVDYKIDQDCFPEPEYTNKQLIKLRKEGFFE